MDDIRVYEFVLKLNTYLNRMNIIAGKFMLQEQHLAEGVMKARLALPNDVFESIFQPLLDELEGRVKLLEDMRDSNDEFQKNLEELHDMYKGTIQ